MFESVKHAVFWGILHRDLNGIEAIDKVRRGEAARLERDGYEPVLKHSRWCLLKRPENRTEKQTVKLVELLQYNLQSVRSHLLREDFQRFWEYISPVWAGKFLEQRIGRKTTSALRKGTVPFSPTHFAGNRGKWAIPGTIWEPLPCKGSGTTTQGPTESPVASTPLAACTAACTSEGENDNAGTLNDPSLGAPSQPVDALGAEQAAAADRQQGEDTDQGDPLAKLAAALLTLSPADRARLAAMLTGHPGE